MFPIKWGTFYTVLIKIATVCLKMWVTIKSDAATMLQCTVAQIHFLVLSDKLSFVPRPLRATLFH